MHSGRCGIIMLRRRFLRKQHINTRQCFSNTFSILNTKRVHKVPRLIKYLGLGKCWTIPGTISLNSGNIRLACVIVYIEKDRIWEISVVTPFLKYNFSALEYFIRRIM